MKCPEPKAKEAKPLNCLQCKHCQLLPYSDFSTFKPGDGRGAPIHCGKLKRNIPAFLDNPCLRADGRLGSKGGDRSGAYTETAKAFLQAHYPRMGMEKLMHFLGRSDASIEQMARKVGVQRDIPSELIRQRARQGWEKRQKLNDAQQDYIADCRDRGFWPGGTGSSHLLIAWSRAIEEEITREVARRGPSFCWRTIRDYAYRSQPGYKRWVVRNAERLRQQARDYRARKKQRLQEAA